jgi:hypothetical protein
LNLVVLTLRVNPPWGGKPLGLPILMRLHHKGGDSLVDLAEAMLGQLAGWLPERAFRVYADGFYAPVAGRNLVRLHLVSRMRRDAVLYAPLVARRGQKKRGRPRTYLSTTSSKQAGFSATRKLLSPYASPLS